MVLKIQDRIQQGTNTTGSGTVTLHVSYSGSGFQDFSVLGNGTQTYYTIQEGALWEVGIGTYSSNALSRDTILDSSAGGSKVNLNGSGLVFCTYPASKAVFGDTENNINVTGLVVGVTGVKFYDGTIQTTAAEGGGFTAATGEKIDKNTSDISTVSGLIPGYSWNLSDNITTSNISNTETVYINRQG